MDITCITNVIGISNRDCPCLEDKPDGWTATNTSHTGYMVDDPEYLVQLTSSIWSDCESDESIWATLVEARLKAANDLVTRLLLSIGKTHTPLFGNINGQVGNDKNTTGALTAASSDWLGQRYTPQHIGATLTMRKLTLRIDTAGTYTVGLYKEDGTLIGSTVDLVSVGSFTPVSKDVTMIHRFTDLKPVYLIYQRTGALPDNSQIYCPTCGNTQPFYYNYLGVSGVQASGLTSLGYSTTNYNAYNYGLFVDFTYQCDYLSWLCDRYTDFWATTPFGRLFGKLMQMLAAYHVNEKILNSVSVNHYTLVSAKEIVGIQDRIAKLSNELMPELARIMPDEFTDCFSCRSYNDMQRKEYIIT